MSEFEHYQNTMRVKRMRDAIRAGERCGACGQVVGAVVTECGSGPGPYCAICRQAIKESDVDERDALRAEVAELSARLECVASILGGGPRSPEQAAREAVAEVERWKKTAAVEFDNRERAVAAGEKLESDAGAMKAEADALLLEGIGHINRLEAEVERLKDVIALSADPAELARLQRMERAAVAHLRAINGGHEHYDDRHIFHDRCVVVTILRGLGPDGKPVP
jgi:hypothetical protein